MTILDDIKKTKVTNTKLPVLDCIKKRFSPRIFSSSPISKSDLEIMFEAARLAPSARNHQPWFFYYVQKGTKEYKKLFGCIPERNYWAKTAPIFIIACYDPNEPADGLNKWAIYDLGAAVISLILQATELGYYCRQIGSFDLQKTKQELKIKNPFLPFILISIGKIGNKDDYKKAEIEIVKKEMIPNL